MTDEYNSKACEDFIKDVMGKLVLQNKGDSILITRHLIAGLIMIMKGFEGNEFTKDFVEAALKDNITLLKTEITEH